MPFFGSLPALALGALALVAFPPYLVARLESIPAPGERIELAGDSVAIYDLAGTVTLVAGGGATVTVDVQRGGSEAGRLRLETGPVRGVPALRVVYPSDLIRYARLGRHSQTTLGVRDDGTFDDRRGDDGGGRMRRVRISGDAGLDAHADLRIAVPAGKGVALHLAVGEVTARNVDGRLELGTASANVTTTGTRGRLRVDVGSGDVRASDVQGDLSIDTGSGRVAVANVRGGAVLSIDTGSGDVEVTGASAPAVNIDTGSGDVSLTGLATDQLKLDTGSGSTTIELASDIRDLDVDTGSGDVTVHAPAGLSARVHFDAGSGDIDSDFPITAARRDGSEIDGTIGDGRGRMSVETGSGDIRLVRR
ncbi:MAG TPA: DUF4097 family beta strand repeat-containing protein [Gemmatimonadales bacterium]|nr:DUF4097 family beta strand repeat-containing protein [Gemmatimonadales bacterium]